MTTHKENTNADSKGEKEINMYESSLILLMISLMTWI